MLTPEENIQYSRHLLLEEIGEEGQEKLKSAKVLVIGAGGLGCPILQYLTAAGIGNIGVIDNDEVDQTNLQRQILYTHQDIGKPKTICAVEKLSALNPYIKFDVYNEKLTIENALVLFKKYDIIVDGSDNFPTRYLVNDAAVLTGKPLVFGSIYKFEGQVSVFNYNNGPTYRCLFPTPPAAFSVPNCSEIGVLGVLPGIIGTLQANEVLKIICGLGEVLSGKLLTYNTLNLNQVIIAFSKNVDIEIKALQEDYYFFCGLPSDVEEITFSDFNANPEQYFLLDVRTALERAEFHIGGLHIPLQELEKRYSEIKTSKEIVVYCKTGGRAKKAIELLKPLINTSQFWNLKGGISNIPSNKKSNLK